MSQETPISSLIIPHDDGINRYLEDKYGKHVVANKAKYRLIWTTNVTEKRHGWFRDFAGEIFLKEIKETRETLKYPFNQNRWCLETLNFFAPSEELCGATASYDSIYFFQDKHQNPLPLNRDVCDIFIYFHIHRDDYSNFHERMKDMEEEEIKKELAEREYIKQKIGETSSVPHLMDLIW